MQELRNGWSRGISSTYRADPETVVMMRRTVGELARRAGAQPGRVQSVRLAVSEAATNAVLHGYHGAEGEIHLTATVLDGELTVTIADDGCGLGTEAVTPGLGWGWKVIADACDALTIAVPDSGGVEVRMTFCLHDHPARDEQGPFGTAAMLASGGVDPVMLTA